MIHFIAEQLFHGVDNARAAGDGSINILPGIIP